MRPPVLHFLSKDIELQLQKTPLQLPEAYREKVRRYWQDVNRDGRFFNGSVLAAAEVDFHPPRNIATLATTDYAHYLYATQDRTHEFDCKAVYAAAVLATADEHLLLGRMAGHTSSPGQLQFPGGGIEVGADLQIDARSCCEREIIEEIGLPIWQERTAVSPFCIKTGGDFSTVGIFYLVRLNWTAAGILDMFSRHQAQTVALGERPEFDELLALKLEKDLVRLFVEQHDASLVDYLRLVLIDQFDRLRLAVGQLDQAAASSRTIA